MPPAPKTRTLNLALQGGGAHGAFTWGVLDALLEEDSLAFEGMTATSAGSMNAAVLISGFVKDGREGARAALESFWRAVADAGDVWGAAQTKSSWEAFEKGNPLVKWFGLEDANEAALFAFTEAMNWTFSPYQLNPLGLNPLRDILERHVDRKAIRASKTFKLFVCATNVRTGAAKVFSNDDITVDALLASAALPFLFQAVEIDGQAYWDGGYMGNPSLWPLFYEATCRDILLVHINPVVRRTLPRRAYAIQNRLNEITFNASLLKELRAIAFVKKLIADDMLRPEHKNRYKDILFHAIRTDDVMADLSIASKYDTDWAFLLRLRDMGRRKAKSWLRRHLDAVGESASVDIQKEYLSL